MSYGMQVPESGNGQVGGGLLGILAPLISGIIGGQDARRERQEHVQDRAEQKKENALKDTSQELSNQSTQQTIEDMKLKHTLDQTAASVGRGSTALSAAFANPALASNPQIISSIKSANDAQGLPTQFNADGTLNIEASRKPITDMDPKQLTYIQSLPKQQRKPLLDAAKRQGFSVPQEMYTDDTVISAKDQVGFERVKGLIGHYADQKQYENARTAARSKYYDELGQLIPGRAALLAADTMRAQASAQAIVTNSNASALRAKAYADRVGGELQRWKQNPAGSTGTVRTLLSNSVSELGQLHTALNDAEKNLSTLALTNPSDDDPTFLAAQQSVQQLQDQVKQATEADQQLRNSLTGNPNVAAAAGAASRLPTTNVSPPSGSPVEGQQATSKSGKPIVFRGGKWEYK